jgi:hypothetical protein
VISLLKTMAVLESNGMHAEVRIEPHNSLLMWVRNMFAAHFMDSNCSHMLCVDDDLRWYPQSVLHMLDCDKDYVCGAYRTKSDDERYAVMLPEGELVTCPHCGCVELEHANLGFTMLHRRVFERMFAAYPELKLKRHLYGLSDMIVADGKVWGEDYAFCKRWRAIGGRAWLDPTIVLTHYGVKGWTGNVEKWLAREGR